MNWMRTKSRLLSTLLIALLSFITLQTPAHAALVGTQEAAAQERGATDRAALLQWLERQTVREQLLANGVDPQYTAERVAALTDAEATRLAANLGDLPAGGNDLIGALVFIFLILLLTDILGLTDVFTFVN